VAVADTIATCWWGRGGEHHVQTPRSFRHGDAGAAAARPPRRGQGDRGDSAIR
jgi:hypothetical protein